MTEPRLGPNVSPKLLRVAERAKKDPHARFTSLAHLIDVDALRRSFQSIRNDAAVGVDGVTKTMYSERLETRLQNLHERLRTGRYRHQVIRRTHIPKAPGKTRPIGVSCIEDKIVQGALYEILSAVYEQDFRDCSFGFRPGRRAHEALRAVNAMVFYERVGWILEADITSFFDSIDRGKLREILHGRVVDGALHRLIGKCLHVGILDGEEFSSPDEGTVQGSIVSPLLGNVYLHHVLDVWFEDEVAPTLVGKGRLVRYADDFVIGFTNKQDAEAVFARLRQRFAEYGLTLQPEKTRLIPFRRPSMGQTSGKGPGSFDFLGFTIFWRHSRTGRWAFSVKTRTARYRKALVAINEWCRRHRHYSLRDQHAGLSNRLRGHFNYFGVNGNARRLHQLRDRTRRIWLKWLQRRSQRGTSFTFEDLDRYLAIHPLPRALIKVPIWGRRP
jgi:group II intron reverse transcriptase/maturase